MKIFKILFLLLLVIFDVINQANAQADPLVLWADGAPGAIGNEPQDIPTITPYVPKNKTTDAAVIVLPGGGYSSLSNPKEGFPVVEWLNSLGITAFLMKYRIAPRYHQPAPLQDITRAVRTVRARAAQWQIDVNKIGLLGMSAGGHLASSLGTHFDKGNPESKDEIERVSSQPDFMALIYPVITMQDLTHPGSNKALLGDNPTPEIIKFYSSELQVTKDTPPTFLVHALGDKSVPVENSILFALALRKAGVSFELHLYDKGRHAFGLGTDEPILGTWKELYINWLSINNFMPKKVLATK